MKKPIAGKKNTSKMVVVKKTNNEPLEKKFKIEALSNEMTFIQYRAMRREIPGIIGKSINTFNNYRDILLGSDEDIPYHIGLILEKYYKIAPGTLSNVKIEFMNREDIEPGKINEA